MAIKTAITTNLQGKDKKNNWRNRAVIAKEVCGTILSQINDRFDFTDRLSAGKLFDSQHFTS